MRGKRTWYCKIGESDQVKDIYRDTLPPGAGRTLRARSADQVMRDAVEDAFLAMTGETPTFTFSGWGGELDESERAVVENREPDPYKLRDELRARLEPIERQIALIEGRDA